MRKSTRMILTLTAVLSIFQPYLTTGVCYADAADDAARAWELFVARDNKGALAIYEKLIVSEPQSPEIANWHYRASWCYWQLDRRDDCFAARSRAVLLTDDLQARRDWQSESVKWYYLAGRYKEGLAVLSKLVNDYPDDPKVADWNAGMSLYYRQSGDTEESIKSLDRAIELAKSPQMKQILRAERANVYILGGQYAKAETALAELIKDYPDSSELSEWNRLLALCCWKQKKYQNCFQALSKAIAGAKDAETKRAWQTGYAVRVYQSGAYAVALSALTEAAKDSPSVDMHRLAARCQVSLRNWDRAVFAFQSLAKSFPQYASEWQLWIGYCYEQQDKLGEAEAVFREIVANYPRDPLADCARLRLSRCLAKQGKDGGTQSLSADDSRNASRKSLQAVGLAMESTGSESSVRKSSVDIAEDDIDIFPEMNANALAALASQDALLDALYR